MTDKGPTEIAKDILWDSFKDARDRNAFRLFSGLIEEIGRRQLGDKWPALMEDERTRPICWLAFSTLAMTLVQSSKTKLPQAELFEKVMTTAISTSMDDGQKAIIEGFLPKLKEAWDEVRSNPVAKAFIEEGEGMNLDDWKAEHGLPNTEDLTVDLETSS